MFDWISFKTTVTYQEIANIAFSGTHICIETLAFCTQLKIRKVPVDHSPGSLSAALFPALNTV